MSLVGKEPPPSSPPALQPPPLPASPPATCHLPSANCHLQTAICHLPQPRAFGSIAAQAPSHISSSLPQISTLKKNPYTLDMPSPSCIHRGLYLCPRTVAMPPTTGMDLDARQVAQINKAPQSCQPSRLDRRTYRHTHRHAHMPCTMSYEHTPADLPTPLFLSLSALVAFSLLIGLDSRPLSALRSHRMSCHGGRGGGNNQDVKTIQEKKTRREKKKKPPDQALLVQRLATATATRLAVSLATSPLLSGGKEVLCTACLDCP